MLILFNGKCVTLNSKDHLKLRIARLIASSMTVLHQKILNREDIINPDELPIM